MNDAKSKALASKSLGKVKKGKAGSGVMVHPRQAKNSKEAAYVSEQERIFKKMKSQGF